MCFLHEIQKVNSLSLQEPHWWCRLLLVEIRLSLLPSGGKITESEYYSSMKQTSAGKQVLQQMILDKVLEKQYGKEVSDKQVNAQYNTYKNECWFRL